MPSTDPLVRLPKYSASSVARATTSSGAPTSSAQLRPHGPCFLQPAHVGMADEPPGARAGEHDGMHAWVAADAVDQFVEFVGYFEAEQAVRATVDPHDQGGSAILDVEVMCHG